MSTELPRRQRATGTRAKICIVASEYNEQYTQALDEALEVLLRGSTDHADLIGSTITQALMQLALEFTTPVIHEVLLLNDEKQAFARCIASQLNRGREAARTAARMAELFLNSLLRQ